MEWPEQRQARIALAHARERAKRAQLRADLARIKRDQAIILADRVLSVTEIARHAGVSRRAVYNLINTIE